MKSYIVSPISEEVKRKFLAQVLLSPDDIQQSVELDKIFQHDSLQKILLKGFIEWLRSPCIEHEHKLGAIVLREDCSKCRRISWESVK